MSPAGDVPPPPSGPYPSPEHKELLVEGGALEPGIGGWMQRVVTRWQTLAVSAH